MITYWLKGKLQLGATNEAATQTNGGEQQRKNAFPATIKRRQVHDKDVFDLIQDIPSSWTTFHKTTTSLKPN